MSDLSRRDAVQLMAGIPLLAAGLSPRTITQAVESARAAQAAAAPFTPVWFTAHEYQTVRLLVDYLIPRDARSGSATDAGVPEFMDFILNDQKSMQTPMRGGLAWLDTECRERFNQSFMLASDTQRRQVLDDIAWPATARPAMSQGVAFFNDFRDLTASGFFSSKMGVEDLQYLGNTVVAEWNGCPPEALKKLGVNY
ncbi:MAG TPA: gluconate 2-dehydrogenase subunit 3 family protein [Gemmatimonadales bacterium]|nr:gluconate 2-dehydrogenase subunit 3 family protein [Gemmatimonadales bacterium]